MKPHLTYNELRQAAFSHLENAQTQATSQTWTDFNTHDPGITIMDVLAYALSDIAYRANLDIKDILESAPFDIPPDGQPQDLLPLFHGHFPGVDACLSSGPITVLDYRKHLLDKTRLPDTLFESFLLNNVWMEKSIWPVDITSLEIKPPENKHNKKVSLIDLIRFTQHALPTLNGLYDVVADFNDHRIHRKTQSGKSGMNGTDHFDARTINSNRIRFRVAGAAGRFYAVEMYHPYWDEAAPGPSGMNLLFNWKNSIDSITLSIPLDTVNQLDDLGHPVVVTDASGNPLSPPQYKKIPNHYSAELTVLFNTGVSIPVPVTASVIGFCSSSHRRLTGAFNSIETPDPSLQSNIESLLVSTAQDGFVPKLQEKMIGAHKSLRQLKKEFNANRNLCEDLATIKAARVEDVAINGTFQVEDGLEIETVMANVFYQLERFISPPVVFNNYEGQLALEEDRLARAEPSRPVEFADIFNGPRLRHGFIDDNALASSDAVTAIYTSDLINIIMDVDGIVWVDDFFLSSFIDGVLESNTERDVLFLMNPKVYKPRLCIEKSKLTIRRGGRSYRGYAELDFGSMYRRTENLRKGDSRPSPRSLRAQKLDGMPQPPSGTKRDMLDYHSIQNDFPEVYGIGHFGLPDSASVERKAQAKQLKGYLFIIEQIIANLLAQVAATRNLFSYQTHNALMEMTYFKKLLLEIPDGNCLMANDTAYYTSYLSKILEGEDTIDRRRNVFIDHLMARHGENLNQFSVVLQKHHPANMDSRAYIYLRKLKYMQAIPDLSRFRARAFDYCHRSAETGSIEVTATPTNISQFEKKMFHKLGIDLGHMGRFPMSMCEAGREAVDTGEKKSVKKNTSYKTDTTTKDDSNKKAGQEREINFAARQKKALQTVEAALEKAAREHALATKGHREFAKSRHAPGKVLKKPSPNRKRKESERDTETDTVAKYTETIFLLEHILLRPRMSVSGHDKTPFSKIPFLQFDEQKLAQTPVEELAERLNDCFFEDPYSFHVTIVLPAESRKFNDPEFQNYAERTMRADLPSHIVPHIYWLEADLFCLFQKLYFEWLPLLHCSPIVTSEDAATWPDLLLKTAGMILILDILNLKLFAEKIGLELEDVFSLLL